MPTTTDTLAAILNEIVAERARQDHKWGEQNHPDGTGLTGDDDVADTARRICDTAARRGTLTFRNILDEETAEACAETDPDRIRAELIQVAAVAVSWIQAIDRRTTP